MHKALLIFFLFLVPLFSKGLSIQELKNLSGTYGWYVGQSTTLDNIKRKHPKLKNQVLHVKEEFNIKFLDSIKNIDKTLKKDDPKSWAKNKKALTRKIKNILPPLSYTQSLDFLKLVRSRSLGNIEYPYLQTLLTYNPLYQKHPELEFKDGYKQHYISDDVQKSKGLNFSVDVPVSWVSKKAYRPNIVRKFYKQVGNSFVMFVVLVYDTPTSKQPSFAEVKSLLNDRYIKDNLPPNSKLQNYGFTSLETLPGYWMEFTTKHQRLELSSFIKTLSYSFFYKNKYISLMFTTPNNKHYKINKIYRKYKPLFIQIANSFVLENLYR